MIRIQIFVKQHLDNLSHADSQELTGIIEFSISFNITIQPCYKKNQFAPKWSHTILNSPSVRDGFCMSFVNSKIYITLRPRHNGCHFADNIFIFKGICWNENVWNSIEISLNFVPRDQINNIAASICLTHWSRVMHICVDNLTIIQTMIFCLVSAKLLFKPMLEYC